MCKEEYDDTVAPARAVSGLIDSRLRAELYALSSQGVPKWVCGPRLHLLTI